MPRKTDAARQAARRSRMRAEGGVEALVRLDKRHREALAPLPGRTDAEKIRALIVIHSATTSKE